MGKIFYVDKELFDTYQRVIRESQGLIERLKSNNFDVCVADKIQTMGFLNFCHYDFSEENYAKRLQTISEILKKYDFLVSHLGIKSQRNLPKLLDNLPNLGIAFISDIPSHYDVDGKMGVFSYDSLKIIDFLKSK